MIPFTDIRFFRGLTLLVVVISLSSKPASAQSFITVMTEQIAKLELDLQQAKQGYDIVQKGLTTISQIKKGDFDLHSLFFSSLKDVNPAIKNYAEVVDILAMESQIILNTKKDINLFISIGSFRKEELNYLSQVYNNLISLASRDIDELTSIVTGGKWQMTDDQRLSRINTLFNKVSDKYDFLRSFSSSVEAQALQRVKDKTSLQMLSKLFQP